MRRRLARALGWAVLGLVILVALLLLFVSSPPGERLAGRIALGAINAAIPGELRAGTVNVQFDRVILEDVALYTPEGEQVGTIARVVADVSLEALAQKRLVFDRAEVTRPEVFLVHDARGLNLLRAVLREDREKRERDDAPGSFILVLPRARITEGLAEYKRMGSDGETLTYRLEDLDLAGSFRLHGPSDTMTFTADVTARAAAPVEAPLTVEVEGRIERKTISGEVALTLGELAIEGDFVRTEAGNMAAELERVFIPAPIARALLPVWPLSVPLSLTGEAQLDGSVISADLEAKAGRGALTATGNFDLGTFKSTGLRVSATDLDLAELLPDGPETNLTFEARAEGGGRYLDLMTGALKIDAPVFTLDRQRVGPLELDARIEQGLITLQKLDIQLPGASLTAKGGGRLEDLDVRGSLRATDLRKTARMIGDLSPGSAPPVSGRGSADFTLQGPINRPSVSVKGAFPQLAYGDLVAEDLTIDGALPDVLQPLESSAAVGARAFTLSGREFRDIQLDVETHGRTTVVEASTVGFADLRLQLEGLRDEDGAGLSLQSLRLIYPEATWTMEGRSHFRFEDGNLTLAPLTLTSGDQRLEIKGTKRAQRLEASASAEQVRLETLPRAFFPESLGLGGVVSFNASVDGALPRPAATLKLSLEGGAFRAAQGVGAQLEANYQRDRVAGTLSVDAPQLALSSQFELPVTALLEVRRAPLSATVRLERLDVGDALALLEKLRAPPVDPAAAPVDTGLDGTLAGELTIGGFADAPTANLQLQGRNLQHPTLLPADTGFNLLAQSEPRGGALTGTLELLNVARTATVRIETPLTLAGLRRDPPSAAALRELPVKVSARIEALPLALLAPLGGPFSAGLASLELDADGSLAEPRGGVKGRFQDVSLDGSARFGGELTAVAGAEQVELTLRSTLARKESREGKLLELIARVDAPISRLMDADLLARAPLELKAGLGPVRLRELPFIALTPEEQEELGEAQLDGTLSAQLTVTGTLSDPMLRLKAHAESLGIGELALGIAKLETTYQSAKLRGLLEVTAPTGGMLTADARITQNLSLPALKKGVSLKDAPLAANLVADRFDLAFLSGVTPLIRELGGRLFANARLGGTIGAPSYRGDVRLEDGLISLFGYGEYRDVQVALSATDERVELSKFTAKSGAGELAFEARAVRQGNQYALTGEGMLKRFPIVVDDQPYAHVSLRTTLRGELSERLVNIRELAIPEATIELPETGRKDLQELDRPDDIVLVRNGVPLDPRVRKRRREAELAAKNGGAPEGEQGNGGGGAPARQYWVTVNAPRNLWVRGADVRGELGLSPEFRIEYAEKLSMMGEVRIRQGRVNVFGRQFEIASEGTAADQANAIRFTGPPKTPYINLTATYDNTSGPEPITVFVTIRGQGKDFTFKVSSQPTLPESEIYTLLATGRRTLKRGSGASLTGADAASVVGSVFASQFRRVFANKLPLDVLSIEAGEEGLQDARVEAGTYLTDDLYIGYSGKLGADPARGENANAVRLEYQLTPRWSLEGVVGDVRREADIIWSKEY